jgi:hypothetical protein
MTRLRRLPALLPPVLAQNITTAEYDIFADYGFYKTREEKAELQYLPESDI